MLKRWRSGLGHFFYPCFKCPLSTQISDSYCFSFVTDFPAFRYNRNHHEFFGHLNTIRNPIFAKTLTFRKNNIVAEFEVMFTRYFWHLYCCSYFDHLLGIDLTAEILCRQTKKWIFPNLWVNCHHIHWKMIVISLIISLVFCRKYMMIFVKRLA